MPIMGFTWHPDISSLKSATCDARRRFDGRNTQIKKTQPKGGMHFQIRDTGGDAAALRAGDPSNAKVRSDGVNWWLMAAEHSALESPLSSNILLPFCYHFWHTFVRLET